MKNSTLILLLATTALSVLAISSCNEDEPVPVVREVFLSKGPNYKSKDVVVLPDVLSLEISEALARTLIEPVHQNLKFNNTAATQTVCQLGLAELDTLKGLAESLSCVPACIDHIPCVRIVLAQGGNTVQPYIEPVLMCTNGVKFDENGIWKQHFTLCSPGTTFAINPDGTIGDVDTPSEVASLSAAINLYRTKRNAGPYGVEVKDVNGNFVDFTDKGEEDGTGHTKEIVYPIEELIAMVANNKIKLWNAVNGMKIIKPDGSIVIVNKHDLLISSGNVGFVDGKLTVPAGAKFADLSNICPPNCSGSGYKFHVLPQ